MKKYAESHEWFESDSGTIGISDHAVEALGDVVFVELPAVGDELTKGEAFAVVESHKAASDIYAPVSGTVTEANEALVDAPERLNDDPATWLVKITPGDVSEAEDLMDEKAYRATLD